MTITNLDEYKCEKGVSITYYKEFLIRNYILYLSLFLIFIAVFWVVLWLNKESTDLLQFIEVILFIFIILVITILPITKIEANSNRDVIFELDRDKEISDEQYIEIFNAQNYKLVEKNSTKIEFDKYVWFEHLNYHGFIEYLDDKVRIKAEISSAHMIELEIINLRQKIQDRLSPPKKEFQLRRFDDVDHPSRKILKQYVSGVFLSLDGMKTFIFYLLVWNAISEFQLYNNLYFYIIIISIFILGYPYYVLNFIKNIEVLCLINDRDIIGDIIEILSEMGYKAKNTTPEFAEYTKPSRFQEPPLRIKKDDPYYLISARGRFKDLEKIKNTLQSRIDSKFQGNKIMDENI